MSREGVKRGVGGQTARSRTLAGARWAVLLNAAALPLGFATNVLLGRVSSLALGTYGAVQVFQNVIYTFLVPGGREVFTRYAPRQDGAQRFALFVSYVLLALAWVLSLILAVRVLFWQRAWAFLGRLGIPDGPTAFGIVISVTLWALATHYLFGSLRGALAVCSMRGLTAGFFGLAILAAGPLRPAAETQPTTYLWHGAVLVYLLLAVFSAGAALYVSLPARRWHRALGALPRGFWETMGYAHGATLINFAQNSLIPYLLLHYHGLERLGELHAAQRYAVLLGSLSVILAPVVAPGISALEGAGQRASGRHHATALVNRLLLVTVPPVLALILFAGDAMALFRPEFAKQPAPLRLVALLAIAAPTVQLAPGLMAAWGLIPQYFSVSLLSITVGIAAAFYFVPPHGPLGGALALAFTAAVQQTAIHVVLWRRARWAAPKRIYGAWLSVLAALALAFGLEPNRWESAALLLGILAFFAWVGRVRVDELKSTLLHLARTEPPPPPYSDASRDA